MGLFLGQLLDPFNNKVSPLSNWGTIYTHLDIMGKLISHRTWNGPRLKGKLTSFKCYLSFKNLNDVLTNKTCKLSQVDIEIFNYYNQNNFLKKNLTSSKQNES